jgi:glucokinase
MRDSIYIGIDLGGTTAKIGAVTIQGKQLEEMIQPTLVDNPEQTTNAIADSINTIRTKYSDTYLSAVGCGVPGILDPENGRIISAANLPGWENYQLKSELEKRIRIPVFIENDANVAALGESWLGAGHDHPNFFMVTLGTGIGGALILNNRLHVLNNVSCEFGHIIIDTSGVRCTCGRTGCLETFFSARGLFRLFQLEIKSGVPSTLTIQSEKLLTPYELAQAAKQNDPAAISAFQKAGMALGIALGNVVNLLGIHFFIISGGIANAWDYFYDAMLSECQRTVFENSRGKIEIVRAHLGEKAGWIGAAALAEARINF